MAMKKCPKCGSEAIDKGMFVSAGGVSYKSDIHRLIFKDNSRAYACTDCGYAELYVNPEYLKRIKKK